ncbi:hypothetical protein [Ruminococcus sp.]|jgi:uncharacterized membrane protein YedE/YeeE|uniref:hypothetical protein n=1 Tax=Ruminococcus sp. TaxID=41978 RepID=UPI00261976EE|nr:hypothetical protein [Ruminococcus sp.]MEE0022136.1 hypothetical protein [Ruminococcus sp.]
MDATTFPISFAYHLIFCLAAGIFFIVQYARLRRPYQLIFAIGMLGSLAIYLDTSSKALFHTVGVFELVLLIGAIAFSISDRVKRRKGTADADEADAAEPAQEEADTDAESGHTDSEEKA